MKALCLCLGILAPSLGLAGQTAPDGPYFEAATIRLNNSGARGSRDGSSGRGGRYVSTNVTASDLVRIGYGVRQQQILNAPSWTNSEHYDISAIGLDSPTPVDRASMWTHLLIERFALKLHHEQRAMNVANLVLARGDRKPGPHLTPASDADADCHYDFRAFDMSKGVPPCSMSSSTTALGSVVISIRGQSMDEIANQFSGSGSGFVFVFDKTNLEGPFNVDKLEYRPARAVSASTSAASVDVPELFTAIQEQLGLKLEPVKEPVDVIVIDSIEHPKFD